MTNIKRIATLDIEGDGLSAERNKELFPEGNHQDPNTIIWSATFAYRDDNGKLVNYTLVSKLPNHTREVKHGIYTVAHHKDTTVIPDEVWAKHVFNKKPRQEDGERRPVHSCVNEFDLIGRVILYAAMLTDRGYKIYCKGYGNHNYDLKAICYSMYRLKGKATAESVLDIFTQKLPLINATPLIPELNNQWIDTERQIKSGCWEENQLYMKIGIKHNIEDAIQLLNIITNSKYIKESAVNERIDSIKEDF